MRRTAARLLALALIAIGTAHRWPAQGAESPPSEASEASDSEIRLSQWVNGRLVNAVSSGGVTVSLVVYQERDPYLSLAIRNDTDHYIEVVPGVIRCDATDEKGRRKPRRVFTAEQWEEKVSKREEREARGWVAESEAVSRADNSGFYRSNQTLPGAAGGASSSSAAAARARGTGLTDIPIINEALARATAALDLQQKIAILESMSTAMTGERSALLRPWTVLSGGTYGGIVRLAQGQAKVYDVVVPLDGHEYTFSIPTSQ